MRTENSLLLKLLPHRFTDFMGPLKSLFILFYITHWLFATLHPHMFGDDYCFVVCAFVLPCHPNSSAKVCVTPVSGAKQCLPSQWMSFRLSSSKIDVLKPCKL